MFLQTPFGTSFLWSGKIRGMVHYPGNHMIVFLETHLTSVMKFRFGRKPAGPPAPQNCSYLNSKGSVLIALQDLYRPVAGSSYACETSWRCSIFDVQYECRVAIDFKGTSTLESLRWLTLNVGFAQAVVFECVTMKRHVSSKAEMVCYNEAMRQ